MHPPATTPVGPPGSAIHVLHGPRRAPAPPNPLRVGPPGSAIHVLHADAGAIAELAAIDRNRHSRRVCLDPVRGLTSPRAPSNLHEDSTRIFDDVVDAAGSTPAGASKGLRSPRLRGRAARRHRSSSPCPSLARELEAVMDFEIDPATYRWRDARNIQVVHG